MAFGINNTGGVVGTYVDAQGITNHGFVLTAAGSRRSTIRTRPIPWPSVSMTMARSSAITLITQGRRTGFSSVAGSSNRFDYPKAIGTVATTITLAGQIAGFYTSRDDKNHGFLCNNGTYTKIDFPNSADTNIYGLNDVGEIVGRWDDSKTLFMASTL